MTSKYENKGEWLRFYGKNEYKGLQIKFQLNESNLQNANWRIGKRTTRFQKIKSKRQNQFLKYH